MIRIGFACRVASLCLLFSLFFPGVTLAADVTVGDLVCEYKNNPLGIDTLRPRLSWKLESERQNVRQTAYRIQVSETPSFDEDQTLLWDSGKIDSDQSIHRVYEGPELQSSSRYHWRVRIWDDAGDASPWSSEAWWEMGLLEPEDWRDAGWISQPGLDTGEPVPSPMFRREFDLAGPVRNARLYITSLGLYEAFLNGERVGDELFTPGWTSYKNRLQYQTYDITDQLQPGSNALGAILGDGWYRGYLGFQGNRNAYGEELALLALVRVELEDGSLIHVSSGPDWKVETGPIQMSDIYMGEIYDARLELTGWSSPGFSEEGWQPVSILEPEIGELVAPLGPPVRRIEEIEPVEVLTTPAGDLVVDMGQNMVGWIRLKVEGESGQTVQLEHAEVLDREGNFYTENLRTAKQTVTYTLKGNGEEIFEPHFTFQGFRYVRVEGFPGPLETDNLTGVVIHSDMKRTGTFQCSDPLINQLQENIVWGQKGNFLDVPTDCPQRDERLGWTGDAQVFIKTASFNMNVASFFTKWLRDLSLDQFDDGQVPHVVPDVLGGAASAAWADAAVIIPWTLYLRYGDRRLLEEQYPSMRRWVEYVAAQAGESYLWTTGSHFGDWLSATYDNSSFPAAVTDKDFIATAFFAHSTDLLARTARVLGKEEDASHYADLFGRIRAAFQTEFLTPAGRLSPSSQTAYALALRFGLLPRHVEAEAADRLVREIGNRDGHISTGFVGTPHLCHVLSEHGHLDAAYKLLHQDTYPSWLYPVQNGATTIWERWDGIRPDGTFQDPGMNSFNHYAYGAIGEWLYGVVAGLRADPEQPGFKHIYFEPRPGGKLQGARATLETPYGTAESFWKVENRTIELRSVVPPNATATIRLPGMTRLVAAGLRSTLGAEVEVEEVEGALLIHVGSGRHEFRYPVNW